MKRRRRIIFTLLSLVLLLCGTYLILKNPFQQIKINYLPQQTQNFLIDPSDTKPINVSANTQPKFDVNLTGNQYSNLTDKSDIKATASNMTGDTEIDMDTSFDPQTKLLTISPQMDNQVKPGTYRLNVKVRTYTGEYTDFTQDFSWGVLAINTNKGLYQIGDNVQIGMAVLDDFGKTKCKARHGEIMAYNSAEIDLLITSPSGKTEARSTKDDTISGSKACGDRKVTDDPDFMTNIKAYEKGQYTIKMTAETVLGINSLSTTFQVNSTTPDFDIARTKFPTRIYPFSVYPVEISITPREDYTGPIVDIVPEVFQITQISSQGTSTLQNNIKTITWHVNWQAGKTYKLGYIIKFPRVVPEFYLVGPVHIANFTENRVWQIASDAIFAFIQENHATTNGATSISTILPSTPTTSNLVIAICYRTSSNTFSTPSGWTLAYNNSSGPRIYMFYRIAPAGMSRTVTCSAGTSGTLGVQAIEFSGNSTSATRDTRSRLNNSSVCNGSPFNNTNTNTTPTNPDVLVVSAFSATSTRTVTGHSAYTDSNTYFNPTTGTFDSSWKEVVNNPPIATADTATYNAGGGTCDNLQVGFNPTFSISQGSYRFFDNQDSITPGGALAAVNTTMQLSFPNYPFRIRFLLDIDSPSGTTMGLATGDFILQYADMTAGLTCNTATYLPVSTAVSGSDIAYYVNPDSGGSGSFISGIAGDPTDVGYTIINESYYEDDTVNITNDQASLANNQAGLWDLSLVDNTDDSISRHYCLRVVNGDGSLLDAYRNYPQVVTVQTDVTIRGGTTIRGSTTVR